MKAAIVNTPGKIEVIEVEKPKLGPEDLIVKVEMCGVCGTDIHILNSEKPVTRGAFKYPIFLGHEVIGKIDEMGKDLPKKDAFGAPLFIGDTVVVFPSAWACGECYSCKYLLMPNLCTELGGEPLGGFSEYYRYSNEKNIFKYSPDMPLEIGVLTEPLSSALRGFERAFLPGVPDRSQGMGPGKTVVIQGSGTIGLMLTFLSKISGSCNTIVIGAPDSRLKLCKDFGADHTIDITEVSDPKERIEQVKSLTTLNMGGDVVIDATGVPSALTEGIQMVRDGGNYVEMGAFVEAGTTTINPNTILHKELNILGSRGTSHVQFGRAVRILEAYKNKTPFHKVVTHKFSLDEIGRAMETAKKLECMKAVVIP